MKKIITAISLCLVSVMLLSLLASCGVEKKLAGTWVELDEDGNETDTILVLASDGTGSVTEDGMSGSVTWTIDGDKIFITVSMCGMSDSSECTFKVSGDTLTLTDAEGDSEIYRKKSSK